VRCVGGQVTRMSGEVCERSGDQDVNRGVWEVRMSGEVCGRSGDQDVR
jgi:hypothetical protein